MPYDPDKINERIGTPSGGQKQQQQKKAEVPEDNEVIEDWSSVPEGNSFEPIPAGVYDVIVEDVDYYISKNNNRTVKWQFAVIGEKYANRKLFDYTTIDQEIGRQIFKRIVNKLPEIEVDWKQFNIKQFCDDKIPVNKPLKIKVAIRNDKDYGAQNDVKNYYAPSKGDEYLADE